MSVPTSWLLIAIVFSAFCLFWALLNLALDGIVRGIREWREGEPWP